MNTTLNRARTAGETMSRVGQAVHAIAKLIEEDYVRKDSGQGDDFLNGFTRGCLLSGLQVLAGELWDQGDKLKVFCDKEAGQ
ncbi:hypothetical protein D9M68_868810 [compost metagenome]